MEDRYGTLSKAFEKSKRKRCKHGRKGGSCQHKADTQTYKVRCAITLAHYVFVDATCADEAERIVRGEIDKEEKCEGYDWYGYATHLHPTFEVEET